MKDNKAKKRLAGELKGLRSQGAELETTPPMKTSVFTVDNALQCAESIVDTIREPLLILDADLKIIFANRNFFKTFQVTSEESIGSFLYDLGNKQWNIPMLRELLEEVLPENQAFDDFEVRHAFQDIGPKVMLLNARQVYRKDLNGKMILLAIEDITERQRLEDDLAESEERFRRLFETANDGIVLLEKHEGKIVNTNSATEKLLGYTQQESIGRKLPDIGVDIDTGDFPATMQALNMNGILKYDDVTVINKDGHHIDADVYLVDKATLVQCNIRDVTERKLALEELQRSEARLKSLVDILQHTSMTVQDFMDYALEQAIKLTGSRIGYIYTYHEDRREFVLNSWSREVMPACTVLNQETKYELNKTGIWGEAVRQRRPIIVNDYQAPDSLKKGTPAGHVQLEKFMTLPIIQGGNIVGVIGLANKETDYEYTDILQISLLMETTWKSIARKKAEEQLQQTLERLRKAFSAIIQVMVSAVEMRDPYTSGHQQRSSDLARAIAVEMGLPLETIEAISMAGPIHDIGKMSVPSELLSKPTTLSPIEFALIKEHAYGGYVVLKDVESPWPLAEIVYQHHERMDGSGYPRSLKGDEILMEARILAVADVVESMASHRPYRPSLGIAAALEEIETKHGTLYDTTVVDACLRLFREKGYQLGKAWIKDTELVEYGEHAARAAAT
ncbi:HD domain-containing phosphohydrolase [Desulfonatronum sp. SC1]|uniref:HD domain-containing phosphohydrolase n=1 Tax=Desulfonatronum sp. SC1 TaxID=2109626 RepID=UPI0013048324|nr:HD domain-containing phosphohydrolase [Desulfonatronum sp. SC1]